MIGRIFAEEEDNMRWLFIGLVALVLASGCAAARWTEGLSPPTRDAIPPGPEEASDSN